MIRRPPISTPLYSSAASDVYKRQALRARGSASDEAGWRRLVDRVVREDGKLLAHLRLLGRGGTARRTPTGAPHAMWAAGGGQPFAPRAGYSRLIRRRSSVRRARTGPVSYTHLPLPTNREV